MEEKQKTIDRLTEEMIEENKRTGAPLPFSWNIVCNECKRRERPGKIKELKEKKQMILERVRETEKEASELPEPEPRPSKIQELKERRERIRQRIRETDEMASDVPEPRPEPEPKPREESRIIKELREKKEKLKRRIKDTGRQADYIDSTNCKNLASAPCSANPNCTYVKRKSGPYCRNAKGVKKEGRREGPMLPLSRKPTVDPNTLMVGETMEVDGVTWMVKRWGGKRPHNRWYEQS